MPYVSKRSASAPTVPQSYIAEGKQLVAAGDFAAARTAFAAAVAGAPTSIEANARLADACSQLCDWPAAAHLWRRVLKLKPGLAVAGTGLAVALRELGRHAEATAEFARTVRDNPQLAAAHFNAGTDHLANDRPHDAATALRRALELDPQHPGAEWNLALALLKAGQFKTGAQAYEARWQAEWRGKERPFDGPRWDGRPFAAGVLRLWGEQGIGDEIMFAGLISAAALKAQAPVLIECAPRLVPLFERSFPEMQVVPRENPPQEAMLDEDSPHAPLGSLPALLWPKSRAPEAPAPYLRADPALVAQMRARLSALGSGRKVGIAWRGGHPAAKRPRIVPAEAWRAFGDAGDCVLVCLQHGPVAGEISAIAQAAGHTVHLLEDVDPLRDMDSFAALVVALDAVVSVDNSTVHLAGALGVPTSVLLGRESDWRWGIDGVANPWYRSVMRFRQNATDDWSEPMRAAVAAAVHAPRGA